MKKQIENYLKKMNSSELKVTENIFKIMDFMPSSISYSIGDDIKINKVNEKFEVIMGKDNDLTFTKIEDAIKYGLQEKTFNELELICIDIGDLDNECKIDNIISPINNLLNNQGLSLKVEDGSTKGSHEIKFIRNGLIIDDKTMIGSGEMSKATLISSTYTLKELEGERFTFEYGLFKHAFNIKNEEICKNHKKIMTEQKKKKSSINMI